MDDTEYNKRVSTLQDLLNVQCSDGNWNHDGYMHGMANGMIIAMSVMADAPPNFLEAPDEFIADRQPCLFSNDEPVAVSDSEDV